MGLRELRGAPRFGSDDFPGRGGDRRPEVNLKMLIEFGVVAFLIMAVSFVRGRDRFEDFCVACFVFGFVIVFALALAPLGFLQAWIRPATFDAALRGTDLRLGLDGFALARFCLAHPIARYVLAIAYSALPLAISVHWCVERLKFLFFISTVASFIAFPFYLLVPACGPRYIFTGWPASSAAPIPHPGITLT